MDGNETKTLGRRALLAAGAAGVAAAAAQAMAGPAAVAAADHDPLKIGEMNTGSTETVLQAPKSPGLTALSDGGDGLRGHTSVASRSGVYGWATHEDGFGVYGANIPNGTWGYLGGGGYKGGGGRAVYGFSSHSTYEAVVGETSHVDNFAVSGENSGTGAHGGLGASWWAVRGDTPMDTKTYGLFIHGRLKFLERSGVLTIAKNKSSVSGSVPALTSSSMVLATLQTNRTGVYIQAAVASPAANKITIYLNKKVTAATKVAYFVLD